MLSGILRDPRGKEHFFVKDPYNNIFQLVTSKTWFSNEKKIPELRMELLSEYRTLKGRWISTEAFWVMMK